MFKEWKSKRKIRWYEKSEKNDGKNQEDSQEGRKGSKIAGANVKKSHTNKDDLRLKRDTNTIYKHIQNTEETR